jgi:hypothetical protein
VQDKAIKVDSISRFSPETPLRSVPSRQAPTRSTSRLDGSLPTYSTAASARRGLRETIGLFESMSHQTDREDRSGHIPKAYSSPVFSQSALTKSKSPHDKQHEKMATKTWDLAPTPRLLSPVESRLPCSYSRSPGLDSVGSQASDVRPLLYTKPSMLKASRHRRGLVSV